MVDIDKWNIDDLIDACSENPKKKKRIVIPKFQRNRVWESIKENELIDSLERKFPIGSLTLYKINQNDCEEYVLLDGLQRTITLIKYINDPLGFELIKKHIVTFIKDICNKFTKHDKNMLESICQEWFDKKQLGDYNQIKNKNYAKTSKINWLRNKIKQKNKKINDDEIDEIIDCITDKTNDLANKINISELKIPVMICFCNERDIQDIFERLNKNGTILKEYQILAATWSSPGKIIKIKVASEKIRNYITQYYDELKKDSQQLNIFCNDDIGDNNEYNLYEYLIGLYKLLENKHPYIKDKFGSKNDYEFIFKLTSACINGDINSISDIPKNHEKIKEMEKYISKTIEFVMEALKPIMCYKTITNKERYIFKPDTNQFINLIAVCYNNRDIINKNHEYYKNLLKIHMVYDFLIGRYKHGTKSYNKSYITNNIYIQKISKQSFINMFDTYIERICEKKSLLRVVNQTDKLILILVRNIKYNANDVLEISFDFEHIIPVSNVKKFCEKNKTSLPINHLGNLCYLDANKNRIKKNLSLFSYLKNEKKTNTEICEKYIYVDTEKHNQLIENLNINDKDFMNFVNERAKEIKNILIENYNDCFEETNDKLKIH